MALKRIDAARLSLAVSAVLCAAAHLFPSPSGSVFGQFWFNVEVVAYAVFAATFLLGLRRWYLLALAYTALNLALYVLIGVFPLPGVTHSALTANLDLVGMVANQDLSRLFSLASYLYLLAAGALLWLKDKGSKLERMY